VLDQHPFLVLSSVDPYFADAGWVFRDIPGEDRSMSISSDAGVEQRIFSRLMTNELFRFTAHTHIAGVFFHE